MTRIPVLALSVVAFAAGCGSPRPAAPGAALPASGEAPGWIKTSATRAFAPGRLSEYIDGDAERFLQAGVEQVATSEYRYRNRVEATADIFVMKDSAGAARVFESQPASGARTVQLGDAARLYPGSLTLRQGRFFVRLVAYQDAPEVQDALLGLARSIAGNLK